MIYEVAVVEAKKLGEPLKAHQMQMLNYANAAGIAYAGLTDGNHWELYDVFRQAPLENRRILEVVIADAPVYESALKLLLLLHPNLVSGPQPVPARPPSGGDAPQPLYRRRYPGQTGSVEVYRVYRAGSSRRNFLCQG